MTVIVHQMCAHIQCLCTIIIMSTWITCSDKVVDTFIIIRQSTIHNTPLLSEFVWISSQASSINSSLWGKTDRQVEMPFRCHYPARSPSTWNNTDMIHHSLFLFILCRLLRHHLNSILRKRTCIYKHLPPMVTAILSSIFIFLVIVIAASWRLEGSRNAIGIGHVSQKS